MTQDSIKKKPKPTHLLLKMIIFFADVADGATSAKMRQF